MKLLQEINTENVDTEHTAEVLAESLAYVQKHSELLQGVPTGIILESAVSYLAGIINQIEQRNILDKATTVDVLTILSVLADSDTREAIHDHINSKQFSIIARHLGDNEKVTNFIKQQARIPSLATMRKNIEGKLTSIDKTEDRNETVVSLRKLRMAYERIQTQLQQHSQSSSTDKK